MPDSPPRLQGDALKHASRKLADEMRAKVAGRQAGVGTFHDHMLGGFIAELEQLDGARPWEESVTQLSDRIEGLKEALQRLQLLVRRTSQGRYVDYRERSLTSGVHGSSDIGYFDMATSQGVIECLQWKGMPLFKTAYDFSLYPMLLWALKPPTVIELGSGSGASAIWLADLARLFGISTDVHSVDVHTPAVQYGGVRFIEGDCRAIETVFEERFLRDAEHPWLLIEDAHVNVYGVLDHFHRSMRRGDYVIVEDSAGKHDDIGRFIEQHHDSYKVDTYFTDFFGRNATCAQDSIFVRIDD